MAPLGHVTVVVVALAACSAQVEEPEAPDPAVQPPHSVPFVGDVGVDWDEYTIPAFAGLGVPSDIAFGAGKLWAAFAPVDPTARELPTLLSSVDGLEWAPVDLAALDLTGMEFASHENVGKPLRLAGDADTIVAMFDSGVGDALTEPQSAPTVLWGDGERWEVTLPEDFPAWTHNGTERDLPSFAHATAGPLLLEGDTIVSVGSGWWWRSGAGSGSRGMTIITAHRDGRATLEGFVASTGPTGNAPVRAYGALHEGLLVLAASSNPSYPGTPSFESWRRDGAGEWNVTLPLSTAGGPVSVADAASTTLGIVALGLERSSDSPKQVAFISEDGDIWNRVEVPLPHTLHRVLQIAGTVFAYSEFGSVASTRDGLHWTLERVDVDSRLKSDTRYPYSADQRVPAAVVGDGAIVLSDEGLLVTGLTLPMVLL